MRFRKAFTVTVSLAIMLAFVFGASVSADTVGDEKLNVMIAAGEAAPDGNKIGQPTEDSAAVKKDQALKIAKGMLENQADYESNNIYFNPRWSYGGSAWSIDFYRSNAPGGSVNVVVDARNGDIINYSSWQNYDGTRNYVVKMTRREAQKIGEKFLKERFGIDASTYELQEQNPHEYSYRMGGVKEQVVYNFYYTETINGIPYSGSTISVGVDGTSGEIRSFARNILPLDKAELPSSEGILTEAEALQKYRESINLSLQYVTSYENTYYGPSKMKVMLGYVPTAYANMISAISGKAVSYDGSETDSAKPEVQALSDNPAPLDPNARLESRTVDEKGANTIAAGYKALVEKLLGVSFDENNSTYGKPYSYNGTDDIWNFNWYMNRDNENASLYLAVNGRTGHVNNMSIGKYRYDYELMAKNNGRMPDVMEKYNWQQCKEKALEIIKQIVPDMYGFYADQNAEAPVYDEETNKQVREYWFTFIRVVNGIKFRDNTIGISINRETGEMTSFNLSWSDLDFPAATGTITPEQAEDAYFSGTRAELSYYPKRTYDKVSGQELIDGAPALAYIFTAPGSLYGLSMIDAVTGKPVDWNGKEINSVAELDEPELSDNWAKRSVELLIAQGIIKNPEIDYDAVPTRAEIVQMLSLAKGMAYVDYSGAGKPTFTDVDSSSEYYYYVENAVKQRIISGTDKNFNGGEPVTKQEFCKLLANMAGFGDIAAHPDIFRLDGVANVSGNAVGSVAICKALGILPAKDGEAFDGASKVTFAEAASALYKALEYIR